MRRGCLWSHETSPFSMRRMGTQGLSLAQLHQTFQDLGSGQTGSTLTLPCKVCVDALACYVPVSICFHFAVGPYVTTPPMDQAVVSPDSATFTCVAEGLARPTITWFVLTGDGPQGLPAGVLVQSMNGIGDRQVMSTLTIANTQPLLAGMYVCNATNDVDVEVAMATLTVNSELSMCCHELHYSLHSPLQLFPR